MTAQMPALEVVRTQARRSSPPASKGTSAGFDVAEFVSNFEVLATATGGVERLRAMTLYLAIRGALTVEVRSGGSASITEGLSAPFTLPAGWAWRRVNEVGEIKLGRQRSPNNHTGPHMRPYLRVANVHEARIDTSDILKMNFEPEEAERFLLARGDVLLNEGQSYELVGRPAIYRGEVPGACFQNTLLRFRPLQGTVLSEYALVVFRAYMRTGRFRQEAQQTTNIAHLSAGRLAVIEFPLPPLAEQKRIVARVDQLMALIDDLEAKQTKKRDLSTRFTKASLEALTTADSPEIFDAAWQRLLDHWDCVSGNSDLVAELRALCLWLALSGRLEPTKLDDNEWQDTTLGDLAEIVTSGSRGWKEFYAAEGALFIRSQDIKTDALDLTTPAFVDLPEGAEGKRTRVQRDDLLVTITGANVGKAARVTRALPEAYVSQHVALIRLRDPRQAPWVHTWLVSPRNGRATLTATSYGDKPGLNLDNVRSVPIRIPTLVVQARIIAKVQHLMRLCDDLEAALCRAEDRASKLIEAVVQEMVG